MLLASPQRFLEDGSLPPTLGGLVVRWMESNLVYGPGDLAGRPYRVDPFLRAFLFRLYEFDPVTGRRLVRRALLGVPKGNSKSEVAGAVGAVELAGPCVVGESGGVLRVDPDVAMAAASYEQADIVYGCAKAMMEPVGAFMDRYEKETLLKDRPGRMYRVPAVAGSNDGRRPTCFIADELHEWVGKLERVHLVLGNGLAKRADSLELNITTAGAHTDTVAGRLFEYGLRVESGEVDDPSFLFMWWQAPVDADLGDGEGLRAAIREANPASWIDPDRIAQRLEVDRIPEYEFRRYHLNQWVPAGAEWLPHGSFEGRADPQSVPAGATVVASFDGSYNRDTTAIYCWVLDGDEPYGFVWGAWERPDNAPADWVVPREEVNLSVDRLFERFRVVEFVADRALWYQEFQDWWDRYGDVVIEFSNPAGHARRRAFIDACALFYDGVVNGMLTHDGNPVAVRHFQNASIKETADGAYIVKDGRNSPRKIDVAVAAIQGYARAVWHIEKDRTPPMISFA